MLDAAEKAAREAKLTLINLDVRETQQRAIQLYEQKGYQRWGTHPFYARLEGGWLTGYFYYKTLEAD